ncbi:MAG TPA: beta-lactamase family protein [Dehalococcoidia bacterium]|nr:beta-lactamase family protein [Dehalococcoidia bacterium]
MSIKVTNPEEVGLSSERLARIENHLQNRYLVPKKIAGALTLVARYGEVAYLSPVGMMDVAREKPMTADTIFRIYSMSKPITAVALMMLYEHGHFQLGDQVYKYIPEWRNLEVYVSGEYPDFVTKPPERDMTIRDLLMHTSGLAYGRSEEVGTPVSTAYGKLKVFHLREGTLKEMVQKVAKLPLEFSPGTKWNYSISTDVCGYLVEVLSGMSFDEYLKKYIFEPLGMVDTGFHVPPEKADRFAANYNRDANKKLQLGDDSATSTYLTPPTFFSGGGGLVSTAADYYRFCQMLMNGGELDGVRLLGPETIDYMTMNHLPGNQDLTDLSISAFTETATEGVGFGLGFAVMIDLVKSQQIGSLGEYYWGGAASTIFWIDPAQDLIVIFLTQMMPSNTFNFRGQLKSLIYPAIID